MEKSKVYFTRDISPSSLVRLYESVGKTLCGNIAIKVHSGEPGGLNFVKPSFMKELVQKLGGTIVECNIVPLVIIGIKLLLEKKRINKITNNTLGGICPMEEAVLSIDGYTDGYHILKEKLGKLKNK